MQDNEVMAAYEEVPMSDAYAQSEYFKEQMEEEEEKDKSSGIKYEKYETVISNPDNSTVKIKKNSFKVPYWVIAVFALTIIFPFVLHYGTKVSNESVNGSFITKIIDRFTDSDAIVEKIPINGNAPLNATDINPTGSVEKAPEELKTYQEGIELLRQGRHMEAAEIFLEFPKEYPTSTNVFQIERIENYSTYVHNKEYFPAKVFEYWATENVSIETCHMAYMYESEDSDEISYFFVYDVEPGDYRTDRGYYLFDGNGVLQDMYLVTGDDTGTPAIEMIAETSDEAPSHVVKPATLEEGMNHEEAAYYKGIAYLRDGKYDEAAAIFLAYPKVYNRSNYFLDIQSTSDYSAYIPSLDKDYKPKKTDLYWAVMNVDSATCHLVYMYDEKDSEDFSYFWVHDIERGNEYSDSTWYLFDKDGALLEIDNY